MEKHIYKFKPLQYTEISVKNLKPVPLDGDGFQKAVANSRNIYMYEMSKPFETIWKFNFATRKWTTYITNIPYIDHQGGVTLIVRNGVLMIYRGLYSGGLGHDHWINEWHICHSTNNFCARLAPTTGDPPPLSSTAYNLDVVCDDEYMYTVGGRSGYDIRRINLKTLVWETVYVCEDEEKCKKQEQNFTGITSLACDGESIFMFKIICFAYQPSLFATFFKKISIFNIEEKEWTTRNTVGDSDISYNDGYPDPNLGSVVQELEKDCLDIYKARQNDELKLYIRDYLYILIWKIDVKTFQWTSICKVPCVAPCDPLDMESVIMSRDGSKHYIITIKGNPAESSPVIFVSWLGIPKLSEMCWEAVAHYLEVFDKNQLTRAGIPLRYVNRIE